MGAYLNVLAALGMTCSATVVADVSSENWSDDKAGWLPAPIIGQLRIYFGAVNGNGQRHLFSAIFKFGAFSRLTVGSLAQPPNPLRRRLQVPLQRGEAFAESRIESRFVVQPALVA